MTRYAVLALLVALGCGKSAKGPLVTHVTTHSAVVSWETAAPLGGRVEVTPDGGGPSIAVDVGHADRHRVTLAALAPDTRYTYRIASEKGEFGAGAFRTAPTDGPFRFIVYGDNRSDAGAHSRVSSAIAGEPDVAFAVNTGDMVADGSEEADWASFFDVEQAHLAGRPLFGVLGNHEIAGGSAEDFTFWFGTDEGRTWYRVRWANAVLLVLDGFWDVDDARACSGRAGFAESCFRDEQLQWVRGELAAAKGDATIDHVFVAVHAGPFSSREGRTGSEQLRRLLDEVRSAKGRLIVSGHDHLYEHGVARNGLHYVVTGGGGAPLYAARPRSDPRRTVERSASVFNYLVVSVDGPRVQVEAKDPDGGTLERFELVAE